MEEVTITRKNKVEKENATSTLHREYYSAKIISLVSDTIRYSKLEK